MSKCKKCSAWCGIISGVALLGLSAGWVAILNSLVTSGAKDGAQLNEVNAVTWKDIPGTNDILIQLNHYMFSVLNPDDVIYKGERPKFEEYGPYIYREYDSFEDPEYDLTVDLGAAAADPIYNKNIDGATQAKGVRMTYVQKVEYMEDKKDEMD